MHRLLIKITNIRENRWTRRPKAKHSILNYRLPTSHRRKEVVKVVDGVTVATGRTKYFICPGRQLARGIRILPSVVS
jgi:hypothetical protein